MSNLILTKTIEEELFLPTVGIRGWFTVELIDARTGLVKQFLRFPNLITNAGLDRLAISRPLDNYQYCEVGTGSTAPAVTDTSLVTPLSPRTNADGGFGNVNTYVVGPPDYQSLVITRLFTEAQVNGNLTEVAMWSALTGGTMFTRQLFKDGAGTPITITKTAADQLRITYEVRLYPPTADTAGAVTLDGTAHTLTHRAQDVSSTSGAWSNALTRAQNTWLQITNTSQGGALETDVLVARTATSSGTLTTSGTPAAYTNGNYYRDHTLIWDPGIANFGTGIGIITSWGADNSGTTVRMFQTKFAPKITKTNVKRLTLVFRHSFNRYP